VLVLVKSIWLMLSKEATFLLTHLTDWLTTNITNLYVTTGLVGIVLAMAIESCCIPLPSEIVMPLAGIMVYNHKILSGLNPIVSILLVSLAGSIGCLIGSIVAYWIGYNGGRPLMLKYGRYVLISQHDADKADRYFQRWGSATVFFSRLLPVVRTYISLPAGIAKTPFAKFCLYTVLGSFPWCVLLTFAGYELGKAGGSLSSLSTIFHGLDVVILIAVVALVALYIWRHIRNDRKAREELAANEARAAALETQRSSQQSARPQQFQSQPWQQPQQVASPQPSWGQQQQPRQQGWGQPQSPQPPEPSPWRQTPPQSSSQPQQWGQVQPPIQQPWPQNNGDDNQNFRR
jgi:membrane protein DedA with SNARE-associated domain